MHRGSSGPATEDPGSGCSRHQWICSGDSRNSRADAVLAVTDDEAVNLETSHQSTLTSGAPSVRARSQNLYAAAATWVHVGC
jgi:hypothetical protein